VNRLPSRRAVQPRFALPPHPHVPARHAEAILAHVVRNLQGLPGPILLGIDGPSGSGKTFAVTEVLQRAKVFRVTLSGADLESPEAGLPAARLRRAYLTASSAIAVGKPAAVVLDDLDASLGRWDEVTAYTVNNQLTATELMHLADSPTRVDGRGVRRTPVIVTGNHLGRLYLPLRRPGRMQIHTWELTNDEKMETVQGIFHGIDPEVVWDLLGEFIEQPIAFFADLRRRAEEESVRKVVQGHDTAALVRLAVKGQVRTLPPGRLDVSRLIDLGRTLAVEQSVKNHLEDGA
jgi:SpoVK/Ycf46/Vps4 family AAA+-type ATPase